MIKNRGSDLLNSLGYCILFVLLQLYFKRIVRKQCRLTNKAVVSEKVPGGCVIFSPCTKSYPITLNGILIRGSFVQPLARRGLPPSLLYTDTHA